MDRRCLVAGFCSALAIFAAPAAGAADDASDQPLITDPTYTHADVLVEIEPGRRINLHCTGSGSPAVVFEAGLGDGTRVWGLVQPEVSKFTRACSYDRAGLGFSDPGRRPGTSANAVDDLHQLLIKGGVQLPYVLVGHSYGGMNIKLFAERYREEVAGLVYIDPTHEDLGQRLWALEPGIDDKFKAWLTTLKACTTATPEQLDNQPELRTLCIFPDGPVYSTAIREADLQASRTSAHQEAWVSEMANIYFVSAAQLRQAKTDLGELPIVVLMKEPIAPLANETQALRDAKNQVWVTLLSEMAAQSRCGRLMVVNKTGHYVELDQPAVVTAAILDVTRAAGSCAKFAAGPQDLRQPTNPAPAGS